MKFKTFLFSIFIIFCFSYFGKSEQVQNQSFQLKPLLSDAGIYSKKWAIFHPFKVMRAYTLSKEVLEVVDSLEKNNVLKGKQGGQLDAFRHAYWMALLTQKIGGKAALKLGNAHENDNYRDFKKGKYNQDKVFSEMDFYNNEIGILIGKNNLCVSKIELQQIVLQAILQGKLKIIKMDCIGNFIDAFGNAIPPSKQSVWESEKSLVNSNVNPC
jgi:hypothetical protein